MSHEFKCLDFDPRSHKILTSEGSAKAPSVSGLGADGIFLSVPQNASFIPSQEFCNLIRYFMENTDLAKDDPRLKLLADLKKAKKVKGWNGSTAKRLSVKW